MTQIHPEVKDFKARIPDYVRRIETYMAQVLPPASKPPEELHEAMRYATLSSGKRIRPLLVYASGECLGIDTIKLDAPAAAIEFIHAFSLVHDDLPAMDNDDLRRGQPTVHIKYGEAIAILAADALQPLAFQLISGEQHLNNQEVRSLTSLISKACGSLGMTGGQAMDLKSEGRNLLVEEITEMYRLKTGALISASIMAAGCIVDRIDSTHLSAINGFSLDIGLAFQIRDDILDVDGNTSTIGKPAGSDQDKDKATWPALFGMDESINICQRLSESAHEKLNIFGKEADPLRMLAKLIVGRNR